MKDPITVEGRTVRLNFISHIRNTAVRRIAIVAAFPILLALNWMLAIVVVSVMVPINILCAAATNTAILIESTVRRWNEH